MSESKSTCDAFELPQRFWDKVEKGEQCWTWKSYRNSKGYGRFRFNGKATFAHRLVMASLGFDIAGIVVRHSCDNPACVNPGHLLLGTIADNNRDKMVRNRHRALRGDEHPCSVLTEEIVSRMRSEYASATKNMD